MSVFIFENMNLAAMPEMSWADGFTFTIGRGLIPSLTVGGP